MNIRQLGVQVQAPRVGERRFDASGDGVPAFELPQPPTAASPKGREPARSLREVAPERTAGERGPHRPDAGTPRRADSSAGHPHAGERDDADSTSRPSRSLTSTDAAGPGDPTGAPLAALHTVHGDVEATVVDEPASALAAARSRPAPTLSEPAEPAHVDAACGPADPAFPTLFERWPEPVHGILPAGLATGALSTAVAASVDPMPSHVGLDPAGAPVAPSTPGVGRPSDPAAEAPIAASVPAAFEDPRGQAVLSMASIPPSAPVASGVRLPADPAGPAADVSAPAPPTIRSQPAPALVAVQQPGKATTPGALPTVPSAALGALAMLTGDAAPRDAGTRPADPGMGIAPFLEVLDAASPLAGGTVGGLLPVRSPETAAAISAIPPSVALPATPDDGFDDSFGQRIVWMTEQRITQAELRVSPEGVGAIDVRLHLEGNRLTAQFSAANPDVRQALESGMGRLRDLLGQHGMELADAQVGREHAGQQRGGQDRSPGATLRGGDGEPVVTTLGALRARGLIDLYA